MHDIKEQLHLDRERLVALAILLGCDYLPKGIPSVGRDLAMKFFSSLPPADSVLARCVLQICSVVEMLIAVTSVSLPFFLMHLHIHIVIHSFCSADVTGCSGLVV